ncbi:MAG TPA: inorganic phosphate transporter [Methanoculleus sp.]|nr:inorganic phosphate transporter [Methanoculleus sp.]
MWVIVVITVALALGFTFTNGFQDAASIAATFIASRSATPRRGILLVAGMCLLGALLGGSAVAFTLSGLLTIQSGAQVLVVLLAALAGATIWNTVTWKYGLPSSSTHALIGGLVGAGLAAAGPDGIYWGVEELLAPPHALGGLTKVLAFLVISVAIGFAGSFLLQKAGDLALRNARRSINTSIVRLNWAAAALMAFYNGANDAQKQLGIIALVLFSAGEIAAVEVPLWARAAAALLLALGTVCGGWRIMNTLGNRIFKIEPIHSFNSQVFSGVSLAVSTLAGAPVSSTHIICTSVLGVGSAANPKKVRWSVGRDIVLAMAGTIPATMLIAGAIYCTIAPCTGV